MSRVHDMGGRFGDGAITVDAEDAPVFEQDWHGRALALTLAAGALGRWNLDISRFTRECLSPRDYARFSYYEKWLAGLADLLVAHGIVSEAELSGADPMPSDLTGRCLRAEAVAGLLSAGGPTSRQGPEPRFTLFAPVKTRAPRNNRVAGGHTRLPRYAAGIRGEIIACHGCHVFPDSNAHGAGERPEPLYTVRFDAADLWGSAERAGDTVSCELWESYLEPAE